MKRTTETVLICGILTLVGAAYAQSRGRPSDAEASDPRAQASPVGPDAVAQALAHDTASNALQRASAAPDAVEAEAGAAVTLDELLRRYVRNADALTQAMGAQDEVHYGEYQLEREALMHRIQSRVERARGFDELDASIEAAPSSDQDALAELRQDLVEALSSK
jgi:hypothetical protein